MIKRLLSGFLAAVLLLTPAAFAAEEDTPTENAAAQDSAAQAVSLYFALNTSKLAEGYDRTLLSTDMDKTVEILKKRIDALGYADGTVTREGDTNVKITWPAGGSVTADTAHLGALGDPCVLTVADADDTIFLTNADLKSAVSDGAQDETGKRPITLTWNEEGTGKLAAKTVEIAASAAEKQYISIALDGKELFRLPVTEKIADGKFVCTEFAGESVKQIATFLNLDPLPLPLSSDTSPETPETPAAPDTPLFPDIEGHWAAQDLTRAVELGLLKGSNGLLLPDDAVKRVEAYVILNRVFDATEQANISSMSNVPANAWYAADVAKAVHMGLTSTADTSNFDAASTRAEAFVVLARAFGYLRATEDESVLSGFSDAASLNEEQRRAASALIQAGIVKGSTDGRLDAKGTLTRAHFVTMLLRIVPNFSDAEEDLSTVSGGALVTIPTVSLKDITLTGDRVFACATNEVALSGVTAAGRVVLKGAEKMTFTAKDQTTLKQLVVDEAGDASLTIGEDATVDTLVIGGTGGSVTYAGDAQKIEVTASNRTINLSGMTAASLTVTGTGNTILMDGKTGMVNVTATAKNNKLTLNSTVGTLTVSAIGTTVDGAGKADSIDVRAVDCNVTLSADSQIENIDKGFSGVSIKFGVPTKVKPGESLLTQVTFPGVASDMICKAQWYQDGKPLSGYANDNFVLSSGTVSRHTSYFTWTKDMQKNVKMGFKLTYQNPSTGKTEELFNEVTVPIENHSAEWYTQRDVNRVLNLVSSTYNGNWTQSYAINNDYESYEKETWVNAKGYSSNSNYLIWINRAYQHVNIFSGSKGNWKLIRSCLVGTGASSTPTPTGLTTIAYKSAGGWNTSTYTVKPVVGFYPGTGYAFHSRLYYPGTTKVMDASIGYPISHGCVRMYDQDVAYIYNNIPVGTAVVIY